MDCFGESVDRLMSGMVSQRYCYLILNKFVFSNIFMDLSELKNEMQCRVFEFAFIQAPKNVLEKILDAFEGRNVSQFNVTFREGEQHLQA